LAVQKVPDAAFGRRAGATADVGREVGGERVPRMGKLFGLALVVALSVALTAPDSAV